MYGGYYRIPINSVTDLQLAVVLNDRNC